MTRRLLFRLREAIRPFWPDVERRDGHFEWHRSRKCGWTTRATRIAIVRKGDSAYVQGCVTCKSVWGCVVCASRIRAERAREVSQLVEWIGIPNAWLFTGTIRHHAGDSLRSMVKGLRGVWRAFTKGRDWDDLRERFGLVFALRAPENTHGKNGWHPHYHVLLGVKNPDALRASWVELSARWRECVRRVMGEKHVPSIERGVDLSGPRDVATTKGGAVSYYLTKLGLELTSITSKAAEDGSRTPFQLLYAFAVHGDKRARELFLEYAHEMHGERALTGLTARVRELAGMDAEVPDEQLAEAPVDVEDIAEIDVPTWKVLRAQPWAIDAILCAAECTREHDPRAQVERVIRLVTLYADGASQPKSTESGIARPAI